jgi:hypothetical protein
MLTDSVPPGGLYSSPREIRRLPRGEWGIPGGHFVFPVGRSFCPVGSMQSACRMMVMPRGGDPAFLMPGVLNAPRG